MKWDYKLLFAGLVILFGTLAFGAAEVCNETNIRPGNGKVTSQNYPGRFEPGWTCSWNLTEPDTLAFAVVLHLEEISLVSDGKTIGGITFPDTGLYYSKKHQPYCIVYAASPLCATDKVNQEIFKSFSECQNSLAWIRVFPYPVKVEFNGLQYDPKDVENTTIRFSLRYRYFDCTAGALNETYHQPSDKGSEERPIGCFLPSIIVGAVLAVTLCGLIFLMCRYRQMMTQQKTDNRNHEMAYQNKTFTATAENTSGTGNDEEKVVVENVLYATKQN